MNITWLKGLVDQLVAYLLRTRHLGVKLFTVSSTVLIVLAGGFVMEVKGFAGVVDAFRFASGEGLSGNIVSLVGYLACITWVIGVSMMVMTYWREWCEADARRVLVVELRGLVDTSDRPLLQALPPTVPGQRIDCLVDVRQLLAAKPPQVQDALLELAHIRRLLRMQRGDTTKANVTVIAGGIMQVPLQFYAGTLIEDEGVVQLYDWERTEKCWKALSETDNESRFTLTGLEGVGGASEVVLAVSASYRVAMNDISVTFPDYPLVHIALPNPAPNTLWSEANQAALTQQFLQTIATFANRGVETVHLILAAPASLSIRFGMAYDGRNMPQLRCYQREADQSPPYPWSISMPQGQRPVEYLLTPAPNTLNALVA